MDIRDKLRKAAGLFVELPPEQQSAEPLESVTVDQIVRNTDGPNLDDIQVAATAPPPSVSASGKVDFDELYKHANLPTASFSAEQMLEMLASLPPELPLNTRRQMVQVSLSALGKNIGASPDTIVADASRKMAALASYTDALTKETVDNVANLQQEIAEMQAKIEEKRKFITDSQQKLSDTIQLCNAESDKLDDVLEFFSLDVPPSKNAPSTDSSK